jgi:hypothetical protein
VLCCAVLCCAALCCVTSSGFYVVHNVFSIMYYVALLQASFDLGNPSFYKASSWMQQR